MKKHRLTVVLVGVVIVGLALWGAMLWLTYGDDNPNDLLIHLGETGATLAVVTVLGGLVHAAFMQRDKTRQEEDAKHAFYRSLLAELKSVYDRVESCRLLVEAHGSAKTYGEQVRALVDGVVTLHNIKRALDPEFPTLKKQLAEPIDKMTRFIKELLKEFRDEYREISHLQEADEAWNKYSRENLPKGGKAPDEYKPLSRAWAAIQELPKLAALRNDDRFDEYKTKFLNYLDDASSTLRSRLPIEEELCGEPLPTDVELRAAFLEAYPAAEIVKIDHDGRDASTSYVWFHYRMPGEATIQKTMWQDTDSGESRKKRVVIPPPKA